MKIFWEIRKINVMLLLAAAIMIFTIEGVYGYEEVHEETGAAATVTFSRTDTKGVKYIFTSGNGDILTYEGDGGTKAGVLCFEKAAGTTEEDGQGEVKVFLGGASDPSYRIEIPEYVFYKYNCTPENAMYYKFRVTGVVKRAEDTVEWSLSEVKLPTSVTSIGESAFSNAVGLTTINLESVTDIGADAFLGCSNLGQVSINSECKIGKSAFKECTKLTFKDNVLEAEEIGRMAFHSCNSLEEVTVKVKNVDEEVFNSCTKLKTLVLPDVIYIDDYAFTASAVKKIKIGSRLETLESYAFTGANVLEAIEVPADKVREYEKMSFFKTNTAVREKLTHVCDFANSTVYVPAGKDGHKVRCIAWYEQTDGSVTVSKGCLMLSDLMEHDFGDYEYSDGSSHTRECKKCQFVQYRGHNGGTATCVNKAICVDCNTAYGETDPDNHENLVKDEAVAPSCETDGKTCGTHCEACGKIVEEQNTISATGHTWNEGEVIKEATKEEEGIKLLSCLKCDATTSVVIPKKEDTEEPVIDPEEGSVVEDDNKQAYYEVIDTKSQEVCYDRPVSKKGSTVKIPEKVIIDSKEYSVVGINKGALKNNRYIKKLYIGKNVKAIEDEAFMNCKELTTVVIYDAKCVIGSRAFYGCKKLTNVKPGKKITHIEDEAFRKCIALKKIELPATLSAIDDKVFCDCISLKTVIIKSTKISKKTLEDEAFKGIINKATIKVPKNKLKTYSRLFVQKGLSKKVKVKSY